MIVELLHSIVEIPYYPYYSTVVYHTTLGVGNGGRESPPLHNVSMLKSLWRHFDNVEQTPEGVDNLSTRYV